MEKFEYGDSDLTVGSCEFQTRALALTLKLVFGPRSTAAANFSVYPLIQSPCVLTNGHALNNLGRVPYKETGSSWNRTKVFGPKREKMDAAGIEPLTP